MPVVQVGERTLTLSNPDKVLYPATGFTKAEIITYYMTVAPFILPHLAGRALTFKRFPDGVDKPGFFEKRCPGHRPPWVPVAAGPGDRGGVIDYCVLDEPAALVWSANLAALDVAEVLAAAGLKGWCKTSGSKGIQLYVPVNGKCTHEQAANVALAIGQVLERRAPERYLTVMTKAVRPGKIFVDWSQNSRHKTTIAPYSLRARDRPTVSTPVSWDEIEEAARGANPLVFDAEDVMARVRELGDLFAPVLSVKQTLPG